MFLYDYGQREEDNVCDIRLNGNVPDEQAFESIKSGVDKFWVRVWGVRDSGGDCFVRDF